MQDIVVQIAPGRIAFFNQLKLPGSIPLLELALSREGRFSGLVLLVPDQSLDPTSLGKAFKRANPVHSDAFYQIIGHADVECSISAARKNVHIEAHGIVPGYG